MQALIKNNSEAKLIIIVYNERTRNPAELYNQLSMKQAGYIVCLLKQ